MFQWSVDFLCAFYLLSNIEAKKVYFKLLMQIRKNECQQTKSNPYCYDESRRKFCPKISLHSDETQMWSGFLTRNVETHRNSHPDDYGVSPSCLTIFFCEYGSFCLSSFIPDLHQWFFFGNKIDFSIFVFHGTFLSWQELKNILWHRNAAGIIWKKCVRLISELRQKNSAHYIRTFFV